MPNAKEIVLSKVNRHLHWPIILFFAFTIGNYSFFRYAMLGDGGAPTALKMISQLRIIFPLWIVVFIFLFDFSTARAIIRQNLDVIFLAISWWISCLVSQNPVSYLLYGPWTLFALLAAVIFICYTAFISGSLASFLATFIQLIWKGNFIVFLLLFPSLLVIAPGSGPYNLLFTSNTFWAYPALVLAVTSLIQARFISTSRTRKGFFYFVYIICLAGIYFSARRSPLFLLLITSVILVIPFKMSHLLVLSALMAIMFLVVESVDIKTVTAQLPDSYMKYRLERMFGVLRGRKETSYLDRKKIWDVYMRSFYEHPFLGNGLASNQAQISNAPKKLEGYSAHNTFVGMLSETGILGVLAFAVMIGKSFYALRASRSILWLKIYLILFLPTLLINWVEYNLIPGQIFFLYSVLIWLLPRGLVFLRNAEPI